MRHYGAVMAKCTLSIQMVHMAHWFSNKARMAELVDARDSKSRSPQRSVGSIPTPGTTLHLDTQ